MLDRHQSSLIIEALGDTPAVLIVGPRQAGKSTIAHSLGIEREAAELRTLDDPAAHASALSDPGSFIRGLSTPVIIDELQRAPDLLLAIKARIDAVRLAADDASGMFLLTGSASIWDTLTAPESLAGRVERVRIWPFSQAEIAQHRVNFIDQIFAGRPSAIVTTPGRDAIADAVITGGFPEVQARSERRAQRWFAEYLSRVLDRDIRELANVRRPQHLYALLTLCATRSAGILNLDAMLADLGSVKKTTGRRYYELLQRVYLIEELPAWGANLARAAVRSPKLVVCDSGLAAHLIGMSRARFVAGPDTRPGAGNLFETFVLTELLKIREWAKSDPRAYHWRDRSGREVDLILEQRDGSVVAVEVKLGESPSGADFAHLAHFREHLGDRFRCGVVICTSATTTPFGDRLWAVPVSALWS